jgi:hypothetical protein
VRILGPALINWRQQKSLADGAMLTVQKDAVYDGAAARAQVGDRFWVREPYTEVLPRQGYTSECVYAIVPGADPGTFCKNVRASLPPSILKILHLCRRKRHSGRDMRRNESRAQLEIVRIEHDGWQCRAIMQPPPPAVARAARATQSNPPRTLTAEEREIHAIFAGVPITRIGPYGAIISNADCLPSAGLK